MNLDELEKVVPIVLHGDEAPVTGRGMMWSSSAVIFSWSSMLATTSGPAGTRAGRRTRIGLFCDFGMNFGCTVERNLPRQGLAGNCLPAWKGSKVEGFRVLGLGL